MEDADIRICMGERREECYIADALQQNNGQGIGVRLKVSD